MPVVRGVIARATAAGSRFSETGSMSQNTGVMPDQLKACGVAGNVNGVVTTSPLSASARIAVNSARVPFVKSDRFGTARCARSAASSRSCCAPMLVNCCVDQTSASLAVTASSGGSRGRVT